LQPIDFLFAQQTVLAEAGVAPGEVPDIEKKYEAHHEDNRKQ
jgi:hypothetical protein